MTFLNDGVTDITLKSKHVFVRAGELVIGNETNPFIAQAKIILYGLKNESHIVYTNAIEAGNKLIANTGTIRMHGTPRTGQLTRLTKTCFPQDQTIFVEAGLDWKAGDKIGLAPTSATYNDSDNAIITSYDSTTG